MKKYKHTIVAAVIFLLFVVLVVDPWSVSQYSYSSLKKKLDMVKSSSLACFQLQQDIRKTKKELERSESEIKQLTQKQPPELLKKAYTESMLHIPSVLVILEQKALKENLNIRIHYELISGETGPYENGQALKPAVNTEPVKEDDGQKNEGEAENPEMFTLEEMVKAPLNEQLPSSIAVTVLPVTVKGAYDDIKEFLAYLEKLNYIEVYAAKLVSEKEIKAEILLQMVWAKKPGRPGIEKEGLTGEAKRGG